MNIHPLNKIKIVGTIVGVLVVGLVVGIKDPGQARANANDNVHGYLFSDMPTASDQTQNPGNVYGGQGLGYISLNNVAPDPVLPGTYGVNFDESTGTFSGYGWSEYGDYVDFSPSSTTPSGSGTTSGPIRIDTNCLATSGPCSVLGWIKFTQSGMTSLGGWDGWVSMHGTTTNGSSYGVMYNPTNGAFSGEGWGSDVVGWVDFSKAKVDIVQPINVCTDPNANNPVTLPLGPGQINDPSQCTYDVDICVTNPAVCDNDFCTLHPALCHTPTDICFKIQGDQDANDFPMTYQGVLYGISNGVCIPDACKDTSDVNTQGFQAYVPFYAGTIKYDISGGVCQKADTSIGDPGSSKPIKPIYKEN